MKLPLHQSPLVLASYMETHILPKASGWQKFGVGAAIFALSNRAQAMINNPKNIEAATTLGIIADDGLIDMDYAREMALAALKHSGGSLPVMGYVIDHTDVEALYETARKVAQ